MACDAVSNQWNKFVRGERGAAQMLVRLAENAHRHGSAAEAIRLIELAYTRFDADYRDRSEDNAE